MPKQKSHFGVVAVLAALGFLLMLSDVITVGAGNADWPWYLLIVFALLQAIAAVAGLLLDAGVITAPVPKPKYEQPNPYGQYGAPGSYYGQPQHGAPTHPQGPPQRGGYPPQQYGGYQGGPSTGGFGTQPPQQSAQQPQGGRSQGQQRAVRSRRAVRRRLRRASRPSARRKAPPDRSRRSRSKRSNHNSRLRRNRPRHRHNL